MNNGSGLTFSASESGNIAGLATASSAVVNPERTVFTDDYEWVEQPRLIASDATDWDYFGSSVSISGDYAVIGSSQNDDAGNDSGSAYIFKRDNGGWVEQAKLTADDAEPFDYFGNSVSISGDYAVVGSHYDDDAGRANSGSAYIFKRDNGGWVQEAKLTADDAESGDWFGRSVSISGNYSIIGAYGNDEGGDRSGAAYIFKRDNGEWNQQAKLTAEDAEPSDYFGWAVSIDGDYAIIGGLPFGDHPVLSELGAGYIFKRDNTDWVQEAKLIGNDSENWVFMYGWFGDSVSISGDYAIMGARYDENTDGSAYIFKRDNGIWSQHAKLNDSDSWNSDMDNFGNSVSISGDYAVVGARYDHEVGTFTGAAYIFKRDNTDWVEQSKLTASDAAANDFFGKSVSISGNYSIIGAFLKTEATGAGAAYIFEKSSQDCAGEWGGSAVVNECGCSLACPEGTVTEINNCIFADESCTGETWCFDDSGTMTPISCSIPETGLCMATCPEGTDTEINNCIFADDSCTGDMWCFDGGVMTPVSCSDCEGVVDECGVCDGDSSSCTEIINYNLHSGLNLIGVPLDIEGNNDLDSVFAELLPDNLLSVARESRSSIYTDDGWIGSISTINEKSGYWVNLYEDQAFSITGLDIINPTYNFHIGHNLVSFPNKEEISIVDALCEYDNGEILSVMGEGVAAIYANDVWTGSLTVFERGKGYWIQTSQDIDGFQFSTESC